MMLSKDQEGKITEWATRQKGLLEKSFGVLLQLPEIDMNKSIPENQEAIIKQLKASIIEKKGKKKKGIIKSPFKDISTAEYKNIKRQLPDSIAFVPEDIGQDATEEIAITYFKDNKGLDIKSLEDTKISPKVKAEGEAQKARLHYEAELVKQKQEADEKLEEKAKAILKAGDCVLLEKAEEIYNYFEEQNLGCEDITLLSQFGLFGYGLKQLYEGAGGIGKSRASVEQLERFSKRFNDSRIKILSGHISPLQMYEILYKFAQSKDLLVIDEGFFILNSDQIQQMMKDALFRGKVYWQSKSKLTENLPDEFVWKGNIIINANSFGKRDNVNGEAFLDRLMAFKVMLSNEQIIKKIKSSRTFVFNDSLENEMMDRITLIRSEQLKVEMVEADYDYVNEFVCNQVQFLSNKFSNISFRTIQKCNLLFKCFTAYFGGMNEYTRKWFENIASDIVKGNTTENFIMQTIKKAGGRIKTSTLREIIMKHFGVKRTQAYDRINNLKDEGKIDGQKEIVLR